MSEIRDILSRRINRRKKAGSASIMNSQQIALKRPLRAFSLSFSRPFLPLPRRRIYENAVFEGTDAKVASALYRGIAPLNAHSLSLSFFGSLQGPPIERTQSYRILEIARDHGIALFRMPSFADNVGAIRSSQAWNGAMTRVRATYASLNAISAVARIRISSHSPEIHRFG